MIESIPSPQKKSAKLFLVGSPTRLKRGVLKIDIGVLERLRSGDAKRVHSRLVGALLGRLDSLVRDSADPRQLVIDAFLFLVNGSGAGVTLCYFCPRKTWDLDDELVLESLVGSKLTAFQPGEESFTTSCEFVRFSNADACAVLLETLQLLSRRSAGLKQLYEDISSAGEAFFTAHLL